MRDIQSDDLALGVVGAGAMGAGIVQVAVIGGIATHLFDLREGAATAAAEEVSKRLDRLVEKGRLSSEEATRARGLIRPAASIEDLRNCDVVVEAVVEKLEVKTELFRQLEVLVGPEAILATNTSSLPIGAISAGLEGRERVVGMHFFNPVPLMKLVEVIPGPDTSGEIVDRVTALARRLGREPVTVADTPGFLVNFGGRAYGTEAMAILQERVATPAQVDAVMRDAFGFRMGPLELQDLTGMDVNFPVTRFIHEATFGDPRLRSTQRHRYMLETGQLGRKTGRGFYRYGEGAPAESADAEAQGDPAPTVVLPEPSTPLAELLGDCGAQVLSEDDGHSPIVVALLGEDCSAHAARTGRDARRLVGCDMLGDTSTRVTVMTAPGSDGAARDAVVALLSRKRAVTAIADSPGFVGQRIAAMVANLGCEMAQMGLAAPEDIDKAMRLGLNYPKGPLELTDALGAGTVHEVLTTLQRLTGDDRYRPSQWLRRRAQLGLSALAV